ncbi:MAG: hypothetical protein ACKVVT_05360 [Dehalococcoidia bacterium]
MSDLAALGLAQSASLLLVAPPDDVMAEAARMRPRPSSASSIMTAEPAQEIVWWLAPEDLMAAAAQKIAWMVGVSHGRVWLVLEEGDALTAPGLALEAAPPVEGRTVFVVRGGG